MQKILVTGVLGFIFSNFIKNVVDQYPEYQFVGIDKAVKDYNLLNSFEHPNYKFYLGDVADQHFVDNVFKLEKPDIVIHGAAESFVDDSIKDITPFLHSNVLGTQCMINSSLANYVKRFIYISTDEVYGQLRQSDSSWTEESVTRPRNPYSASKLAGELIVYAASQTHGLNYNITRSSNNYGPCQPQRNLVPKVVTSILNNEFIPIHGSGKQIREWLYVQDNCDAIMTIVKNAPLNEIYNIGSGVEKTNLEIVEAISSVLNKKAKIKHVEDRLGHDFRYSIDCSKIKQLGWDNKNNFDSGIEKCVNWYIKNSRFFK